MKKLLYGLLLITFFNTLLLAKPKEGYHIEWSKVSKLPLCTGQSESLGVAGPFVGVHNNALLIAGGANFTSPQWETEKSWCNDIWVLTNSDKQYQWHEGFKLNRPIAYGISVSTVFGVFCAGGKDAQSCYSDAFILKWDSVSKKIVREELPALPMNCSNSSAAVINNKVYIAGGTKNLEISSAMKNFWRIDLTNLNNPSQLRWETLPPWPGSARAYNITIAQHNGYEECVYVIGGCMQSDVNNPESTINLSDIYEFLPSKYEKSNGNPWRKLFDSPRPISAAAGISYNQSHIFVFGGADERIKNPTELKDNHPGFRKDVLAYHTITNTWIEADDLPFSYVTTSAVKWNGNVIIAPGEIRPRYRSPDIWTGQLPDSHYKFGALNYFMLFLYLFAMLGVGIYFIKRNKNTEDFFRGGKRVPSWAAGLSIFATLLSSITFIAMPAKVYATDWTFIAVNMVGVLITIFIIVKVIPYFCEVDAASAYEYLEKRFNLYVRLFAAASFVLMQIGRMAIVMFLPALAMSTITSLSVIECILITGIFSIIYSTIGGLEAVVWTDAIQAIVLFGGAFLSLFVIFHALDGGISEYFAIASANHKFNIANWDFSPSSITTSALWVILLGGIGQNLIPGVSDQAVVQRYLSVSDLKSARKSVVISLSAGILSTFLFFSIGTALYVFYKVNPARLNPSFQTDAVFPLFIASELPVGIAGLVVASIFAAAQSTIATSMHSISTVVVTDFVKRFSLLKSDKSYLNLARFCTFFFGCLGTAFAVLLATVNIISMWESFMSVLGLFGGAMCGLFLLGMFTKRVGGTAAISGAILGTVILFIISTYTPVSFLLYATIGITACFVFGLIFSFIIPEKKNNAS